MGVVRFPAGVADRDACIKKTLCVVGSRERVIPVGTRATERSGGTGGDVPLPAVKINTLDVGGIRQRNASGGDAWVSG
ncbi:hypothetical protein FACS189476_12380 [Spirochaetia bacterium]|nr:hypothetical protein FACS189476_12380 [Spirochaetia bacterium]